MPVRTRPGAPMASWVAPDFRVLRNSSRVSAFRTARRNPHRAKCVRPDRNENVEIGCPTPTTSSTKGHSMSRFLVLIYGDDEIEAADS
ncbi:MAG: hypothetical protein FWF16_01785 [Microbacteriaceae bacterium]|nr:hypothetical protein [Microbacteriaceae bacterium]